MTDVQATRETIVLAGGTGDLGGRIAKALIEHGAAVRAIVRPSTPEAKRAVLRALGIAVVAVDDQDTAALTAACAGAACVVSAMNGLSETIIATQGRLLDAAVAAGVPRFIPSDFALDYTRTQPGGNRNLDLRRAFMTRIDASGIRATSILNGAFADMLTGQAPIVLKKPRKILFWGSADQAWDFTAKDDVAAYTAAAALDASAPRFLRIAGDVVTARRLAETMTAISGTPFGLRRAGSIGLLSVVIRIARTVAPQRDAVFPVWQGMQYMRDMSSGAGKLDPLDNDRYGSRAWISARDILSA